MALELGALRDALIEAKVSPEKASAAAEEVAAYERDLAGLKEGVAAVRSDLSGQIADVKGDVKLLKWMLGFNLVITSGVLFRLLTH